MPGHKNAYNKDGSPRKVIRKSRAALTLRRISLAKLHEQTKNVLARDMKYLLERSAMGPLTEDEAATLVKYHKIIGEMKETEKEELENLTDEELAQLAKKK